MMFVKTIAAVAVMVCTAQLAAGQSPAERAQEQQRRDQLRIAVQGICPVTGETLGSMGEPLKVQVGEETVFLCCKGCAQQEINPEHWATIRSNIAKAQRICPVMKKELPEDPESTIVDGQVVFICCPPCSEKIANDPQTYLRNIDTLYASAVRDQLRIAVQEICPISGKKLGSMGEPIKVQVGEETVFLCCQECMKQQIKPEYWATIHTNVAKAQGICPVMKHALPKTPKWTIVEGQIVYVCCPPCTKKINADPHTYLSAVDQLYAASLDARKKVR